MKDEVTKIKIPEEAKGNINKIKKACKIVGIIGKFLVFLQLLLLVLNLKFRKDVILYTIIFFAVIDVLLLFLNEVLTSRMICIMEKLVNKEENKERL